MVLEYLDGSGKVGAYANQLTEQVKTAQEA